MAHTQVTFLNEEATVTEVMAWLKSMAEKGILAGETAQRRITALERLTSVLGREEARDLTWLRENIEGLGQRWATKEEANPQTATAYVSRARMALEDYAAWRDDPLKFKPRKRESGKPAAGDKKARAAKAEVKQPIGDQDLPPSGGAAAIAASAKSVDLAGELRSFPLAGNRAFRFELPAGGVSLPDVRRIALHLLTYVEDFDPLRPEDAQIFSIVRAE